MEKLTMEKLVALAPTSLNIVLAEKVSETEANHFAMPMSLLAIKDVDAFRAKVKETVEVFLKESVTIDWSNWDVSKNDKSKLLDASSLLTRNARVILRSIPNQKSTLMQVEDGYPIWPKGEPLKEKIDYIKYKTSALVFGLFPESIKQAAYGAKAIRDYAKSKTTGPQEMDFEIDLDSRLEATKNKRQNPKPVFFLNRKNPLVLLALKLLDSIGGKSKRSVYPAKTASIVFNESQVEDASKIMSYFIEKNKDGMIGKLSGVQILQMSDSSGMGIKKYTMFLIAFFSGDFAEEYRAGSSISYGSSLRMIANEGELGLDISDKNKIVINEIKVNGPESDIMELYKNSSYGSYPYDHEIWKRK